MLGSFVAAEFAKWKNETKRRTRVLQLWKNTEKSWEGNAPSKKSGVVQELKGRTVRKFFFYASAFMLSAPTRFLALRINTSSPPQPPAPSVSSNCSLKTVPTS
jgi:hypothetical protein